MEHNMTTINHGYTIEFLYDQEQYTSVSFEYDGTQSKLYIDNMTLSQWYKKLLSENEDETVTNDITQLPEPEEKSRYTEYKRHAYAHLYIYNPFLNINAHFPYKQITCKDYRATYIGDDPIWVTFSLTNQDQLFAPKYLKLCQTQDGSFFSLDIR
jgi:hypothetical protein